MAEDDRFGLRKGFEFSEEFTPQEVLLVRGESPTPEAVSRWRESIENSQYTLGVRQADTNRLAAVSFVIGNAMPAQLVDGFVHPDFRRQRIGSALLDKLVYFVRQAKIESVIVISDPNKPWQSQFLEGHGFQTIPNAMMLVDFVKNPAEKPEVLLNDEEQQELELIAKGLSLKEISGATGYSHNVVVKRREKLLDTLDAKTPPHAVRRGHEARLLKKLPKTKKRSEIALNPLDVTYLSLRSSGKKHKEIIKEIECEYSGARLMKKLGAKNMAQAVHIAISIGWLEIA